MDKRKRASNVITPQEQRLLISAQTRINTLNARLKANDSKLNKMKDQITNIRHSINENKENTVQMEHEEDILRLEFIEAKLLYEYGMKMFKTLP
jgi:uncharacterized protein YPO0396